jgi:hypothetical protein
MATNRAIRAQKEKPLVYRMRCRVCPPASSRAKEPARSCQGIAMTLCEELCSDTPTAELLWEKRDCAPHPTFIYLQTLPEPDRKSLSEAARATGVYAPEHLQRLALRIARWRALDYGRKQQAYRRFQARYNQLTNPSRYGRTSRMKPRYPCLDDSDEEI